MSSIIVEFKPKGHKDLERAIQAIKNAENGLTKSTKTLKKETDKTNKSLGIFGTRNKRNADGLKGLGIAFSTLRSRMLLFNFALSLGTMQLFKFGKQAAQVESLTTAFTTLSGGSSNAAISIEKLQEATNNTMSEMELFKQANNAMVLGVSKNSDEMAELFDIAQRLGRALGRDTTSSVESLVTGIGRQSRLMLDNIGIIVKAEEAYKRYALELGVSEKSLTNAQRRQAFLNATLESARTKLKSLGKETLTSQDAYDQFNAATADLNKEFGKLINDSLIPVIKLTTEFIRTLDADKLKDITKIVISLGVAFVAFKNSAAIIKSIGSGLLRLLGVFISFSIVVDKGAQSVSLLSRVGKGLVTVFRSLVSVKSALVVGVFFLTKKLLEMFNVFGLGTKTQDKFSKNTKIVTDNLNDVNTSNASLQIQNFIDKLKTSNEFLELVARSMQVDLIKSFDISNIPQVNSMDLLNNKIKELSLEIKNLEEKRKNALRNVLAQTNVNENIKEAKKLKEEIEKISAELEHLQFADLFAILGPFNDEATKQNLQNFLDTFTKITGITAEGFFQTGEAEALQKSLGSVITTEEQLLAVLNAIQKKDIALNEEAMKTIANNVTKTERNKELAESFKIVENAINSTRTAEIEQLQNAITFLEEKKDKTDAEKEALIDLMQKQEGLNRLRKLETFHLYEQFEAYKQVGNAIISVSKVAGVSEKNMLALQVVMATANAFKAASDTWADTSIQPTLLRGAVAASHFAAAYANVRGIQNQMQKASSGGYGGGGGAIGSFEYGGLVGGQRHSQGGTIIEAEQGEFVMSRNAVQSIGLETLNQMNEGGSTGNVVINVSGNVMTQDFVEGELAESIKEAVRRGSDFGIG